MIRSLPLLLLLAACSAPCWTARDIEYRDDCDAFHQVIVDASLRT